MPQMLTPAELQSKLGDIAQHNVAVKTALAVEIAALNAQAGKVIELNQMLVVTGQDETMRIKEQITSYVEGMRVNMENQVVPIIGSPSVVA